MATNLNIIKMDYYDGSLIIIVAFWHGDKITISVPLTDEVREKIRACEK